MRQNIINLTICFLAIVLTTACGNGSKDGNSESNKTDTSQVKKEVPPTKSPEDYGIEMADAKCKKETANNEGRPLDAKEWNNKMDAIKAEFESKYGADQNALEKADGIYEYWLEKCPAMQDRYKNDGSSSDSDSSGSY